MIGIKGEISTVSEPYSLSENQHNLCQAFYMRTILRNVWFGRRPNKRGAALTQKCGDDWLLIGVNPVRVNADMITEKLLKSKDRSSESKAS